VERDDKRMRVAIMQPYFLPYIGYYQLMAAVDVFVVYDNIKYTKKGWINRNRMLQNGKDVMFSLPLKSASDSEWVIGRELAPDFKPDKLLSQLKGAYQKAPYFSETFPLLEQILRCEDRNLFGFLHSSIVSVKEYLGLNQQLVISSTIAIDHSLRSEERVIAICEALGARTYINAIGGTDLYSKEDFMRRGIELKFVKARGVEYLQFDSAFVPWLSIVDVLMFNSLSVVKECVASNYDLI
jgi:hypothetical protein